MTCNKTLSRNRRLSTATIILCWLSARIYVYSLSWPFFLEAGRQKETLLGYWYLPSAYIRDHYWSSLYYLRGKPPLPQAILGLLMKIETWPFAIPVDSFLLSIMTLVVAFILRNTLMKIKFNIITATFFSTAWCFSPHYLTVEINGFPTAFYEALTAFLLMILLWSLVNIFYDQQKKSYWLFAISSGLLPLARSTMAAFFVIPVVVSCFFKSRSLRWLGFTALIVQLAWAGKNYIAYQQLHFETVSDIGTNMLWVLGQSGNYERFERFVQEQYPDNSTYRQMLFCVSTADQDCLNRVFPMAAEKDAELKKMGIISGDFREGYGMGDSYIMREVSEIVKPLYVHFALKNPKIILEMFKTSYLRFWGPIYSQIPLIPGFNINPLLKTTAAIIEGYKYVCVMIVHFVTFPLALWLLWHALRRHSLSYLSILLLYTFGTVAYVALVTSFTAYGENTRYRVDVEPLIWLLPFMTLAWFREQFRDSP